MTLVPFVIYNFFRSLYFLYLHLYQQKQKLSDQSSFKIKSFRQSGRPSQINLCLPGIAIGRLASHWQPVQTGWLRQILFSLPDTSITSCRQQVQQRDPARSASACQPLALECLLPAGSQPKQGDTARSTAACQLPTLKGLIPADSQHGQGKSDRSTFSGNCHH